MANININSTGRILTNSDVVSINIELQKLLREEGTYGIGVLPMSIEGLTFFNAFDLNGIGRGYFTNPLQIAYGPWVYGYGRELTETIREDVDQIIATITITPADTYRVRLNTRGPGQIYMYVNPTTYAYGYLPVTGGFATYDGITDSNGILQVRVGVPLSDNEYNIQETDESGNTVTTNSFNAGAGSTELLVSVLDKIPNPDPINVVGYTSTTINTLAIPVIGYTA